jgi:hypothetical protein
MSSPKEYLVTNNDIITIHSPSDTHYWCKWFSISPFTLFHLLKTVGNSATEIGEFLHNHEVIRLGQVNRPTKDFTIL